VAAETQFGQLAPLAGGSLREAPLERSHEAHYTVAEIAEAWKLSADTVRKVFENEPGVLVIANTGGRSKGGYRTLRVPESVRERVHRRLSNPDLTSYRKRAYHPVKSGPPVAGNN
jgi:predicted transcriptional regulator